MGNSAETISEVIDNLRRAIKAINEYSKSAEKETGLTGHQLWAIKLVAGNAPIKVSDLARQMYLHPATVVGYWIVLHQKDWYNERGQRKTRGWLKSILRHRDGLLSIKCLKLQRACWQRDSKLSRKKGFLMCPKA